MPSEVRWAGGELSQMHLYGVRCIFMEFAGIVPESKPIVGFENYGGRLHRYASILEPNQFAIGNAYRFGIGKCRGRAYKRHSPPLVYCTG